MNEGLAFRENRHAGFNGKERSKAKKTNRKGTKYFPLNSEKQLPDDYILL